MAANVEERVVEMRFDNGQFEKGAAQTLSTLQRLQNALNLKAPDTLKEVERASKEVDLSTLADSVQTIENRFSTMGIIGATALQEITKAAINTGKNILTAIPKQIVQGGWARASNVADAKFQLEGLGVAWEDVADDIDHAVMGTRFGADAAAKAASQLAASGVKYGGVIDHLEDGTEVWSDMGRALRGISGTASMANSEFEDIAEIFTTVAGQGKLMTYQLNQLSFRGLNVAAGLGKVFGKTEGEIREMVTKGKISFKDFADAMDTLYGEFATKADQTLKGSMANMKAALSRIGQDYAQTIFAEMPKVFVSIKEVFNKLRTFTRPIADSVFTPTFTRITYILESSIKRISDRLPDLNSIMKREIKSMEANGVHITRVLAHALNISEEVATTRLQEGAIGIGDYVKALKNLTYANEKSGVYKFVTTLNNLAAAVMNVGSAIASSMGPIGKAFNSVFNTGLLDVVYNVSKSLLNFSSRLIVGSNTARSIQNIFEALFKAGKLAARVLSTVVKILSPFAYVLLEVGHSCIELLGVIGDMVSSLLGFVNRSEALATIFKVLCSASEALAATLILVLRHLTDIAKSAIVNFMARVVKVFRDSVVYAQKFATGSGLLEKVMLAVGFAIGVPVNAVHELMTAFSGLSATFSNLVMLKSYADGVSSSLGGASKTGGSFVDGLWRGMKNIINLVKSFDLSAFVDNIKNSIFGFLGNSSKKNAIAQNNQQLQDTKITAKDLLNPMSLLSKSFTLLTSSTAASSAALEIFKNLLNGTINVVTNLFSRITFTEIFLVGLIASVTKMVKSFTSIGSSISGLIGSVTKVTKSFSELLSSLKGFVDNMALQAFAQVIITVAASISILVLAFAHLASVPTDKFEQSVWSFGLIVGSLALMVGFLTAISLLMKQLDVGKELGIIELCVMNIIVYMLAMTHAINTLSKIQVSAGLIAMIAIIAGALILFVKSIGAFEDIDMSTMSKAILAIISFSASMLILSISLRGLAKMDFSKFRAKLGDLIVVVGLITAIALIATKLDMGSIAGKFAFGMFALSLAFFILAEAFSVLTKIDRKNLDNAMVAIITISLIYALMAAVFSGLDGGNGALKIGLALSMMSTSILLLAGAFLVLSLVDPHSIKSGLIAIAGIAAVYAIMIAAFANVDGGKGAIKVGAAIAIVSASLLMMVACVAILSMLDPLKILKGIMAIQLLLLSIGLFMHFTDLDLKATSLGPLIALFAGIFSIAAEIMILSTFPPGKLLMAVSVLSAILLVLSLLIKSVGKQASYFEKSFPKGFVPMILSLVLAIGTIGGAIALMAVSGSPTKIVISGLLMVMVLKVISDIINELIKNSSSFKSIDKSIVSSINAISVLIGAIGGAISAIVGAALVTGGGVLEIIASAIALNIVLSVMTGLLENISELKFDKKDSQKVKLLNSMIFALIGISVALMLLSTVKVESLVPAVIAMVVMMKALGALLESVSKIKFDAASKKNLLAIPLIAISMLIVAKSLRVLATIDFLGIIKAISACVIAMGLFFSVMYIIDKVDLKLAKKLPKILALVSILGLIIAALWYLTNTDTNAMLGSMAILAGVFAGFGLMLLALSLMQNIKASAVLKIILSIASLLGMTVLAIFAISKIVEQNPNAVSALEKVTVLLIAITAIIGISSLIGGKMIAGAVAALVSFTIFIGGLIVALSLIGELFSKFISSDTYNKIDTAITQLTEIGGKIATGIGTFISNLVGTIATSFSNILQQIGSGLSSFMVSFQPFLDLVRGITFSHVLGTLFLGMILVELTAFSAIMSIMNLLTGTHISSFAYTLTAFGTGVTAFANVTAKINHTKFEATSRAIGTLMKSLLAVNVAEAANSLFGWLTGKSNLGSFKTTMSNFADAVMAFYDKIKDIDMVKMTNACSSVYMLATSLKQLPNTGGLLGKIVGNNNIERFPKESLSSFAEGIVAFSTASGDIDLELVEKGTKAASMIFSLTPPRSGGLIGMIFGNNNFEKFDSNRMGTFATGIKAYADGVNGIVTDGVESSVDALAQIFTLTPPDEGGVLGFIAGENSFDKFDADRMGKFAAGITAFANGVATIEDGAYAGCERAISVFSAIADKDFLGTVDFVASELSLFDDMMKAGGITGLSNLEIVLTSLANVVTTFTNNISNTGDLTSLKNAMELLKTFYDTIASLSHWDLSKFQNFTNMMYNLGSAGLENIIKAFGDETAIADLNLTIDGMFTQLGDHMKGLITLRLAFVDVLNDMFTAVNDISVTATALQAGESICTTFENGMESAAQSVYDKGVYIAGRAADGLKQGAIENGPTAFNAGESLIASGSLQEGMEAGEASVYAKATEIPENIAEALKASASGSDVAVQAGKVIIDGVDTGISAIDFARWKKWSDTGANAAKAVSDGAKAEAYGPSQQTMQEAGSNLMAAGEKGITDKEESFADTMKNAVDAGVQGYKKKTGSAQETIRGIIKEVVAKGSWDGFVDGLDEFKSYLGKKVGFDFNFMSALDDELKLINTDGEDYKNMVNDTTPDMEEFADASGDMASGLGKAGGAAGKAKNEIQEFNESLLSSLNSKTGGMSFFNKLELKAETSAQAILENMKSNIEGIAKWTDGLQQLMARGLDKGLVKTLADAGIDSYDQISAFLQMSDEEIQQANDMFLEAADLRASSAASITDGYFKIGTDSMQGWIDGLNSGSSKASSIPAEVAQTGLSNAQDVLETHSPSKKYERIGIWSMQGLMLGMSSMAPTVYDLITRIAERIVAIMEEVLSKEKTYKIGKQFLEGLYRGLSDETYVEKIRSAAEMIAALVSEATSAALEINSPSKVAIRIGQSWDEGLADGIFKDAHRVETASEDVANLTVKSLQGMTSTIANGIDLDPVVRPMLDLSRLKAQAASIGGILDSNVDMNAINNWSNPSVRNRFLDDMANRIGSEYADKVVAAINNKDSTPHVYLEGDANGVFRVVQRENRKFIKRTGYNGLV